MKKGEAERENKMIVWQRERGIRSEIEKRLKKMRGRERERERERGMKKGGGGSGV